MPQRRDDEDDEQRGADAGDARPRRRSLGAGMMRLVDHVLRAEQEDEGEEAGEGGVGDEQPVGDAGAADAEEVVAGEDGERRDRRQDVAGELGAGEARRRRWGRGPEDEELGEGVAGAGVAEVALRLVADFPLGDGDVRRRRQRARMARAVQGMRPRMRTTT